MTDELIGKRVGGYEIAELVGRGGMAVVYRAHQISMNRRPVAIKILPRQLLNDETYMQRFMREVHILTQLEHRNIVPVHDYGEFEGQPYIVMRFMDGGSVDDLIRQRGPLTLEQMRSFITQIAPALDYAHMKNVLHRDLKPSNILLDDDGGAYLTDFGIARLMGDAYSGMAAVTTHGVIGTPSYMSPEQAQGKPLDGRSDLYALGVTLFEMATAARPFEGDTPYSIAVLQVTAQPPAPRSLNSALPTLVERVILKAMSKRPDDRYPTAAVFAEALIQAINTPDSFTLSETQPSPSINMMDTQPGFQRPDPPGYSERQPERQPTPPEPPPQVATGYVAPPSFAGTPPRSLPRARRRGSLLTSVLIGAVIGCAMLTLVAALAALLITNLTGEEATPTPTIDATATEILATNTTLPTASVPTRTPFGAVTVEPTEVDGGLSPVGLRPTPTGLVGVGSLIFFAERGGNFDLYRLDLATRLETRLTDDEANDMYGAASPDGSQIAFQSDRDGDFDIYVIDIDGSGLRRLTDNTVTDRIPSWTPDGENVIFSSDTRGDGTHDLVQAPAQGGEVTLIFSDGERNSHPRVSDDGRYVIFTSGRPDDASTWDIKRLDLSTNEVIRLTNNEVKDWSPSFTPDGEILYLTDGAGYGAVAQMDFNGDNARILFDGAGYEWSAQMHPNERGILINSDEGGRDELYLLDPDGTNLRALTILGGAYGWWLP
ncbi:MAG: protein kinase [Chloroflexi bacterium]|nr:protein kinase [Chloroflexota bacterium]